MIAQGTHSGSTPWHLGAGTPGLVSYIIPAYNAAPYIFETLESCRLQSYRPLEVVVVNDGSTDDTEAIAQAFRDSHHDGEFQVRCLSQPNAGVNAARNVGLQASSGDVIGFVDADDMLPVARTTLLYEHVVRNSADLVYGQTIRFVAAEDVREHLAPSQPSTDCSLEQISWHPVTKWTPGIANFLTRREFAERVGPLAEHLQLAWEDAVYPVQIRCAQPRMFRSQQVVYLYRRVPGSNADKSRPEAVRCIGRAIQTIVEFLKAKNITDSESWRRVGDMHWQYACWALRLNLTPESIAALDGVRQHGERRLKWRAALLGTACRVPGGCQVLGRIIRTLSRVRARLRR